MKFFKSDSEKKEIVLDALMLYTKIINTDDAQTNANSSAYLREYKKILRRLNNSLGNALFSSISSGFIVELMDEINPENIFLSSNSSEVQIIEGGLKKILTQFNTEVPERKILRGSNRPTLHSSYPPQSGDRFGVSQDIKSEIDQAIIELKRELERPHPNVAIIRRLVEIIRKGSGYGAVKALEITLKKSFDV